MRDLTEFKKVAVRKVYYKSKEELKGFTGCKIESFTCYHKYKGRYCYEVQRWWLNDNLTKLKIYTILGKKVSRNTFFKRLNN